MSFLSKLVSHPFLEPMRSEGCAQLKVNDHEAPGDAEHVPGQAGEQVVVEVERDQLEAAA